MDFDKRYLIWGAAGLGGLWLFSKFARGAQSSGSGEALGPSYVSYVAPGGGGLDYLYEGLTPTGAGGGGSQQNTLLEAARLSSESTQNILNSETLLASVTELVTQQQTQLGFSGKYGFTSDVQAALNIEQAGSPSFTFQTEFTPKDPSNAAKVIGDLEAQNAGLSTQVSNLTAAQSSLQNQVNRLKSFDFGAFISKFNQPVGRDYWYKQEVNNIATQATAAIRGM